MKCDDRKLIVGEFSFEDITIHLTPAGGERQSRERPFECCKHYKESPLPSERGDGCVYVCLSQWVSSYVLWLLGINIINRDICQLTLKFLFSYLALQCGSIFFLFWKWGHFVVTWSLTWLCVFKYQFLSEFTFISAIFNHRLGFYSKYTAVGSFFLLFEFYNFDSVYSHQSLEKQKLLFRLDDSIIIQCQRCCEKQACTWCYQIKAFESPPSRYAVNEVQLSFRGQV